MGPLIAKENLKIILALEAGVILLCRAARENLMSHLLLRFFDVPTAIAHFLNVAEYVLFQLVLFACFVIVLGRMLLDEWRRK
jgi:hypothetical protein